MYESTISQKVDDLAQEVENLMHTNRIPAKVTVIPKVKINDVTEMMLHINELGSYCSAKRIYYKMKIYINDELTNKDIRFIKKMLESIKHEGGMCA